MSVSRRRPLAALALAVAWLSSSGCAILQTPARGLPAAVTYWHEERTEPRPLRIHILKIDLTSTEIELAAGMPADPDGNGPAESVLTDPLDIGRTNHFVAAVNANAFGVVSKPAAAVLVKYPEHATSNVIGLVAVNGKIRSKPETPYIAFWIDREGHPNLGNPGPDDPVWQGVAGFGWLIRDGRNVATGTAIHPRTAIGFDADRHYLYLVVVDGRQPGFSEGMTTPELAGLMAELGCQEASNLDGGGSSVMILEAADGRLRVINSPSTTVLGIHLTRPVPAMLGIRRR